MNEKDYTTISPSAASLLVMKGYTGIPYAKQMAALLAGTDTYTRETGEKDFTFRARALHFERRYFSIDSLMKGLQISNILELSSGFSGLGQITNIRHQLLEESQYRRDQCVQLLCPPLFV
jgi:hypothetical protein